MHPPLQLMKTMVEPTLTSIQVATSPGTTLLPLIEPGPQKLQAPLVPELEELELAPNPIVGL